MVTRERFVLSAVKREFGRAFTILTLTNTVQVGKVSGDGCCATACECKMLCLHIISYIVAGGRRLSWDKSLELFVQSLEMDFSLNLYPFCHSRIGLTISLLSLLLLFKPPLLLPS